MSDDHIKKTRIDALVRELQEKTQNLAAALEAGKPYLQLYEETEKLVLKLRSLQTQSKNKQDGTKRDWKPFLQWLKENDFPNVQDIHISTSHSVTSTTETESSTVDEGYGLAAQKNYSKADLVLEVPLRFMMTSKTALDSKLGLLLHSDMLLQSIQSLVLALHLLMERFTLNSFWGPYITTLPKVVDTPLLLPYEKVVLLREASFFEDLIKVKLSHFRQYCHVYFRLEKQLELAVMKRSQFTFELFTWAVATTSARQNQIQLEGKNGPVSGLALIPVYDLLNHEGFNLSEITSDYDYEKKAVKMFAARDFKKDEQIKIFYGPRTNVEFFFFQGFTVPLNPNNFVGLPFQLIPTDKLREKKAEILQKKEIPERAKYAIMADTPITSSLMGFMRLALINNEEDLKNAEAAFQGLINYENEERALTMLEIKFQQAIDSFPTKLEEDEEAQKKSKGKLDFHLYQVLIDEKKILHGALKATKDKKKKLQQKIKEKEKKAKKKAEQQANPQPTTKQEQNQ